jgi:hypothetical protein
MRRSPQFAAGETVFARKDAKKIPQRTKETSEMQTAFREGKRNADFLAP